MTQALLGYSGPVLVNDIGVIAYYGASSPIDIYGLANNDSLRLQREGHMNPAEARKFAARQGARVGVFQICWPELRDRLPEGWQLVEAWTGPRNIIFHHLTIGFMAADPPSAERLARALASAPAPRGVHRHDAGSSPVRHYAVERDKDTAIARLCNEASLERIGKPDPTYARQN
jgi:hypothetical protein